MARRVLFATHGDMLGPFALLSLRGMPRRPSVRQVAAQMMNSPQATLVRNRPALVNAIPNPTVPGAFIESPGWISAMRGGGLDGLGYLGATDLGVGLLKFQNDHAANNFISGYGGQGGCDDRGGTWTGAGSAVRLAAEKYTDYRAAADYSAAAQQFLDVWESKARALVSDVDRLQQFDTDGILKCGRSDVREAQYKTALRLLKNHVMVMANAPPAPSPPMEQPQSVPEVQVQNQGSATVNVGNRAPSLRTPLNRAPQFFQQAGGGTVFESAAFSAGEKKFPWVPVLVGGGIFVAGTAFLLMRRR